MEGALAFYLEPWHADVYDFLDLAVKHGELALDRFYALWVPDLFMERVNSDGQWSLFSPDDAPGLSDCWGEEFEKLYSKYEKEGRETKIVQASQLWLDILISLCETGDFCVLFKDNCHRNGMAKSTKTCTEIVEFTSPTGTITSNLASLALAKFVREKGVHPELAEGTCKLVGSCGSTNRYFDFDKLAEVTALVTNNLNKIIDVNNYPVEASCLNSRHCPIGINVHGLADTFILLGMPFDSPEARQLNKDIFETIYYHALKTSCALAVREGTCDAYQGSALSKGILQPDMWGVAPSGRWDWDALREMVSLNGVRNTVALTPLSPTLTSQILGCNVSIEPYASYVDTLADLRDRYVVNKHLSHDLTEMGLWSSSLKKKIIEHEGSIERIPEITSDLKAIYRTAYEIKPKTLVDMALDRGCYVSESQIINLKTDDLTFARLHALQFYIWKRGRC